jgi:ribosome-binding protein aMBF1 (putative translation factor)
MDRIVGSHIRSLMMTLQELFPGSVAKAVREARLRKGLTREEVERLAKKRGWEGINATLLYSIETGRIKKTPSDVANHMGELLEIDTKELWEG